MQPAKKIKFSININPIANAVTQEEKRQRALLLSHNDNNRIMYTMIKECFKPIINNLDFVINFINNASGNSNYSSSIVSEYNYRAVYFCLILIGEQIQNIQEREIPDDKEDKTNTKYNVVELLKLGNVTESLKTTRNLLAHRIFKVKKNKLIEILISEKDNLVNLRNYLKSVINNLEVTDEIFNEEKKLSETFKNSFCNNIVSYLKGNKKEKKKKEKKSDLDIKKADEEYRDRAAEEIIYIGQCINEEKKFINNQNNLLSCKFSIIIIGSAFNCISEEFKTDYLDFPWEEIRTYRNKLAHSDDGVNKGEIIELIYNIYNLKVHDIFKDIINSKLQQATTITENIEESNHFRSLISKEKEQSLTR